MKKYIRLFLLMWESNSTFKDQAIYYLVFCFYVLLDQLIDNLNTTSLCVFEFRVDWWYFHRLNVFLRKNIALEPYKIGFKKMISQKMMTNIEVGKTNTRFLPKQQIFNFEFQSLQTIFLCCISPIAGCVQVSLRFKHIWPIKIKS